MCDSFYGKLIACVTPSGSGKSYLAKMLRDLEIESGGDAPRIYSMDDYFMTEVEKVCVWFHALLIFDIGDLTLILNFFFPGCSLFYRSYVYVL